MSYKIVCTGFCLKTGARTNNEDNLSICGVSLPVEHEDVHLKKTEYFPKDQQWFAVFDGMGGMACGEEAAFCAAQSFAKNTREDVSTMELVSLMDEDVMQRGKKLGKKAIGTTVVAIEFGEDHIRGFNIGDSRCYCLSNGNLEQLSTDHVVESPYLKRNCLWQALGVREEDERLSPSEFKTVYHDKDLYLLCTDGLFQVLSDKKIQMILSSKETDLKEKIEMLEKKAVMAGVVDNMTALLLEVRKDEKLV